MKDRSSVVVSERLIDAEGREIHADVESGEAWEAYAAITESSEQWEWLNAAGRLVIRVDDQPAPEDDLLRCDTLDHRVNARRLRRRST